MKTVRSGLVWAVLLLLWWPFAAQALTVSEVASDLACPCSCPLILEDCNMTCGLDWKNEIGGMIQKGQTKEEIVTYFINTYGEKARLTPWQRVEGKVYQYTRGFDAWDWGLLWAGIGLWSILIFGGIHLLIRRYLHKPRQP